MKRTWIKNARIVNEGQTFEGSLVIENEIIAEIMKADETPSSPCEETIDAQVMEYADLLRKCWQAEQEELRRLHKLWSLRQPMIEARIAELREEIRQDEEDIDELLMLKIQRGR